MGRNVIIESMPDLDKARTRVGKIETVNFSYTPSQDLIDKFAHKKVFIRTYGCQANYRDEETIMGLLSLIGMEKTENPEEATIAVLNTCAVRENAEDKVYGEIGQFKNLKAKNKDLILMLCGCMVEQKHIVEDVLNKFPHVDIFFGTHNLEDILNLLEKFIKDKNTTSSFFDAARQSRPKILKYLAYLDNFDPNKSKDDNYTILHIAVYNDSINVIKAIFEIHKKKPISLNAKLYTNQYTSLHLAVSKHFIRYVKLLISHDEIDVNAHSKRGITPLHLAVEVGDLEIVKVLAAHPKVDINAKAFKGYTPLHFAIKKERMEILKYLSSLPHIDLNALNNDGESPLFYAVRKAHKDSIAFFDEIFQSKRYHLRKLEQEGIIFDNMNN